MRIRRSQRTRPTCPPRLARLCEGLPLAAGVLDRGGAFVHANAALGRLLGRRARGLVGVAVDELLAPAQARRLRRALAGGLRRPASHVLETAGSGPPSAIRWRLTRDGAFVLASLEAIEEEPRPGVPHLMTETMFDRVGVGLCQLGTDGRFLRVNQRLCDLLGRSRSELAGFRLDDLTFAPDLARVNGLRRQFLDGELDGFSCELRCVHRTGGLVWVQLTFTADRSPSGEIVGLLCVAEDIVARKEAEESRRRTEVMLAQAERVAQLGSWELDLVSGRLEWSDEIYRIFELDPGRFPASYEAFLDLVHPADRSRVDEAYVQSVNQRVPYDIHHRLVMRDGRIKYVHERGETRYDQLGTPVRSVGTVQDVTRERLAAIELRAREASLQAIFDATSEAMVVFSIDPPGGDRARISYCNRLVLERLRSVGVHEPLALLGRDITEPGLTPPALDEEMAQNVRAVQQVLATGQPMTFESRSEGPGGRLWTEVSFTPIRDDEGRVAWVLYVGRDTTARHLAESALRASLAEKETLLREAHHRVKNNLQVISSMLALQGEDSGDSQFRALVQESRARIQTIALVHEQLYRTNTFSSVDLGAHLRELTTMIQRTWGAEARVKLDVTVEPVQVDLAIAVPVGLLINELVSNAFKHGFPEGRSGSVAVRCASADGQVTVTVADDGVGLPGGRIPSTARTLGFRIVNTLAHQVRARLDVQVGGGTSVSLTLPLERALASVAR